MPVDLTRIWLNDAADPSDSRGFAFVGDSYQVTSTRGGGVEDGYASGRSRGYSTPGDSVHVSATFHLLDADDRAWLTAHRGRPVCFRDPRGIKVFVTYYGADLTFTAAPLSMSDDTAGFDATSVTFSEAIA